MCISPITQQANNAQELRQKNASLCTLQAELLSAPRKQRQQLRHQAEELNGEIQRLQSVIELERVVSALRSSISAKDDQEISRHVRDLTRTVRVAVREASDSESDSEKDGVDEALFYLIGVSDSIVNAMHGTTDAGVIGAGCEAFCSLFAGVVALENGDEILKQIMGPSLAEAVVAGMMANTMDRNVQYFGCRILTNLAVQMHKFMEKDDELHFVWVAGARVAVGKARRNFAADSEVTTWADQVMRYL